MTSQQLIERIRKTEVQKIGKAPVVVLPLKIWEEIEGHLEEADISRSRLLAGKISKARREKKWYSASEVRKMFGA